MSVVSQRQVGDLTGLTLGSYLEIQDRIGRGGMGSVYLALHRDWNLSLAVKSPRPDLLSNATDKERWLREAQTWIDLGLHPNIVRCWFIREHEGIPLLFLDYIAGGSLKEAIDQRRYGAGNWTQILDYAIQACDGLHHAHVCGIVHRDVKPANLLLDESGRLFVTDFGLVKLASHSDDLGSKGKMDFTRDASLTSTGTVLGTPNYCAPEQWMQDDVGVPADLYAMGVVLYEMVVGQLPFEAGPGPLGLGQLLTQVLSEDPQPPSRFQPSIPPALEAVILRLLSKDPKRRHPSASELRQELAQIYRQVSGRDYPRSTPKPIEAVVDVLNNKAVSLYSLGRPKAAEATWQEALRLDSLHPEVVFNRGWLLWRQGRLTPTEWVAQLKQVKVTYARGAAHCGVAHLLGGETELAEQNLASAVSKGLTSADCSFLRYLGDARMGLEDYSQAEVAYREALRINPGDLASAHFLEMAQQKTRRLKGRCLFPKPQALLHIKRQHRLTQVQRAGGGWLWLGPEYMELLPADQGRRSWSIRHDADLHKVAVSTAADRVVALEDLPAGSWSLSSGQWESSLSQSERHFCLSPDGQSSLVGLVELRVQGLADGRQGRPLRGHEKQVMCASFCGGPQRLLTGSRDRTARYWDLDKALCLLVLQGHRDIITCLSCCSASGLAVTGSSDHSARVWLLTTGECFRVLEEAAPVQAVALAQQGRFALVQTAQEASLWDLSSGTLVRRLPGLTKVSPDGMYLATTRMGEGGPAIDIRELESGCLRRSLHPEDGPISDLCYSEDGRFLAAVSLAGSFYLFEFDEPFRVLPQELMLTYTRGGQDLEQSLQLFQELLTRAESACASTDYVKARKFLQEAREVPGYRRDPQARRLTRRLGQHLARSTLQSCWENRLIPAAGGAATAPILLLTSDLLMTANDKVMRLWDYHSGNCLKGFPGHSETIRALALNSDNSQAISGSLDRGVRRWDLQSGQCLGRVAVARGGVIALHWLPHSNRGVALTNQYLLSGIDLGASLEVFQAPAAGFTWMLGSRHLCWLGGPMSPGFLQIVDGKSGKVVKKFSAPDHCEMTVLATAAVVYGEGRYGLTAGPDGRVHLWDIWEGRYLAQLLQLEQRVAQMAISANGLCLALGLENGWVQLWDLDRRQLCQVVEGPWGKLSGLNLAPDACELYLIGSDQVLRIWEMEWQLLGQSSGRQLSDTLPKASLLSRLWRGFR